MAHVHKPTIEDDAEPAADPQSDPQTTQLRVPLDHRSSSKWFLKVGLEVLLISVGVFLALMGEQWRESSHERELAQDSLRRFRAEIVRNREAVAGVKDYHANLLKALRAYLQADPKTRQTGSVQISGLRPVFFDQTAWDLAIATQSLAHIDPQVAYGLSRIYGLQRTYLNMTQGIMQAIFVQRMKRPRVEVGEPPREHQQNNRGDD